MKSITLILLFVFSVNAIGEITPQSFGLNLKNGQIDFDQMTKLQKDTIVINYFTNTDVYLDIAVFYKSKNEIVFFKNLGNGFLDTLKKFSLKKNADKIEAYMNTLIPPFLSLCFDLIVYNKDATQTMLMNSEINSLSNEIESMAPYRDISYDPKIFLYDFHFVQKWISERASAPANPWTPRGDVDNDGKNEFIYTFYPVNDTMHVYTPGHIVIFESYADDKIRIDWDTTFYLNACGTFFDEFFDFDRNGKKEFYARAPDPLTGVVTTGLFECSGEGKYKFHSANEIDGAGLFQGYVARDTMKRTSSGNAGIWVNYYDPPPSPSSRLRAYAFTQRGQYSFNFAHLTNGAYAGMGSARVYDMEVGEIDGDPQEEIILGNNQWSSNYFNYLDSTGTSSNAGYQLKTAIPGARVSAGFLNVMNYDENEIMEITMCGIAIGRGSIGIVKHTGAPGENQFATMWWDTVGIAAAPNWGIDTGKINNEFTVLFPFLDGDGVFSRKNISTYSRNGLYSYQRSSFTQIDSLALFNPRFIDLDNDKRVNIVAPGGIGYPGRFYVFNLEYDGLTFIQPNANNVPIDFTLKQNYPNPFNPITKIQYSISPQSTDKKFVKLIVHNIIGEEISKLVNEERSPGNYEVQFDGSNQPSGVYFYSLFLDNVKVDSKKMIILK